MSDLFLKYSMLELHQKLIQKELSCSMLADEVSRMMKRHEPNLHAFVCYDLEHLKSQALLQDSMGKMGLPFGIKDIFNTKIFPTQMGSPIWKNFRAGNNARVVDSLINAGHMMVGKTVTAEFAVHALNETLNPHDVTRTPGTSSSGSAAAVARGIIPFALATQTAGSIVRPANFCGVWGMKPSFGMIPRTGVLKTTDSLDTIGFIAAHSKNLKVILDQVRVKGPDYPFVYKQVDQRGDYPKDKKQPWRIGIVKTHIWEHAKSYVQTAFETLAESIANVPGFIVEEIKWPESFQSTHTTHSTIYAKSLAYYFKQEKEMASEVTPLMLQMIEAGEPISPEIFKTALSQQREFIHQLDELLKPYDFVLSLGTSSSAPLRHVEELPDPSLIWTLGHVPSIAAPMFRCPEGLPFGVQFISRKWNDYVLLQGIDALVECGILPAGSTPILHSDHIKAYA